MLIFKMLSFSFEEMLYRLVIARQVSCRKHREVAQCKFFGGRESVYPSIVPGSLNSCVTEAVSLAGGNGGRDEARETRENPVQH